MLVKNEPICFSLWSNHALPSFAGGKMAKLRINIYSHPEVLPLLLEFPACPTSSGAPRTPDRVRVLAFSSGGRRRFCEISLSRCSPLNNPGLLFWKFARLARGDCH